MQTAEGSLNEMHAILQRVRELSVQWANGTLSTSDQAKITAEVAQLTAELVRIRDSSKFNGIALFSSSAATNITIQVGANGNVDVRRQRQPRRRLDRHDRLHVGLDGRRRRSTPRIDQRRRTCAPTSVRVQNRLEHTIANLGVYQENLSASESRIRDVDVAQEMVNFTKLQILSQSGTSMLAQANQSAQGVLSLLRG